MITPLNQDAITPELIANHIATDAAQIASIYVVAFSKTGEVWEYISGDAKGMAFAGCILNDHSMKVSMSSRTNSK